MVLVEKEVPELQRLGKVLQSIDRHDRALERFGIDPKKFEP